MLFADVVATSAAVAATRSRTAKIAALAGLLAACDPADAPTVVGFLTGEPRQGRVGVGWATVASASAGVEPAAAPSLTVADVDDALSRIAAASGPGAGGARTAHVRDLVGLATAAEGDFLRHLLAGELRQGALAGIMVDAVARASGVAAADLRRAVMLSGDLGRTASLALAGGTGGLAGVRLELLRPVQPMLASGAASVADALGRGGPRPAAVESKVDGVRIQLHRAGDEVRVFTRNLNDVTPRLPELVGSHGPCRRSGSCSTASWSGPPRPGRRRSGRKRFRTR